jgi:prepilin-type processing-associated H-X9-DG protein
MNVLEVSLIDGAIRATAFAVAGIILYWIMRRWSPAAGSLTAAATLVLMGVVSLLALCPWLRFPVEQLNLPAVERVAGREAAVPGAPEEHPGAPTVAALNRDGPETEKQPFAADGLLGFLVRAWDGPVIRPRPPGRTWGAWGTLFLLACLAIGTARLATGLWAMWRIRSRSRPVADQGLLEMLEILRAEMSCVRPVELRTAADLATAATIGWRRPIILLPDDWHGWDEAERRAVLAHELAHVCRGDFLTGLLAQFSLAAQFYHPLAHWLSARLRLEQELAADAWTARLSGGNLPYLATLARMALRREQRAPGWPARAFLPSRGTFVRRIEMLRDSKNIRHVLPSPATRVLTVGALAALGLLAAGLRWVDPASVRAQTAQHTKATAAAPRSAKGEFDLSLVPAETRMVLAVQPAALFDHPEMAPIAKAMRDNPELAQPLRHLPETIDQIVVFWEGMPEGPSRPGNPTFVPAPSGVVIRWVDAVDWDKLIGTIVSSPQVATHSGQRYYRPGGDGGHQLCAHTPDDRTLVLAEEDSLQTLIEDRKGPRAAHAWDEAWNQAARGQMKAAVETRWLRRRLNQGQILDRQGNQAGQLGYDSIAPLLEKTRAFALSIDVDNQPLSDLVATVSAAEDLKDVKDTMQALLTLGKNAISSHRRDRRDEPRADGNASDWALGLFASALDNSAIESAGQTVHLRSTAPVDMAEASRILLSFLSGARADAQRMQSVNHLKQIGLAFHNYHASKNGFPPPVLYGGKTGKVPYSWRVAILPYLEAQELYNEYNFDEPWDGPNNRKLIDQMPAVYGYAGTALKPGHTAYFVFTGPEAALGKGDRPTIADITDGSSNTVLAVEARREVPWTKPEDITFDPLGNPPEAGGFTPEGFNVLFVDGSVRFIRRTVNPNVLKALITRAGGEVLSTGSY